MAQVYHRYASPVSKGYSWLILLSGRGTEDIGAAEQITPSCLPAYLKRALLETEGEPAKSVLETVARLRSPAGIHVLLTKVIQILKDQENISYYRLLLALEKGPIPNLGSVTPPMPVWEKVDRYVVRLSGLPVDT